MKRLLLLCLLAGLASATHGQTRLSLGECVRLALENNKRLAAADAEAAAARYEEKSARANFFPSLSLTGTGLYGTSDGTLRIEGGQLPVRGADGKPTGATALFPGLDIGYELGWLFGGGVKIEQPVYRGGKVRTAYRIRRLGGLMALENRRLTESEVIVETCRAYADAVRAGELCAVAESYRTLLEELLRSVESAQRHGLKPQNDVLKVRVRLDRCTLDVRRAENGRRLAAMHLCHLIGKPLDERIEVAESLPALQMPAEGADITARPEYAITDRRTELAAEQVRLARSERLPQVGVAGSYGYLHGLEVNGGKLFDGGAFTAGVSVSVPLFRFGGNANKVQAAKARLEKARIEQADLTEQMTLELARAANNLDEARLEIALSESTVASAEENLHMSRRQYEAGLESLSDFLEAQALWRQARSTQVEAAFNARIREIEYRKAAGLPQVF